MIKGRKVENPKSPTKADVNYFKKVHKFEGGGAIDLNKPVHIDFQGYKGFLTPKDEEKSTEGITTMGLTSTDKDTMIITDPNEQSKCIIFANNRRPINI